MKNKRESGEVVVEASIIVTIVLIFVTMMLYICMVLYQQTLVSVMANQTAANLAQVYGNTLKDPFSGYIDPEKVYQSVTYNDMRTDAYLDVIEQKANVFANYRLKSSRVMASENTSVDVQIIKKPNEVLKSQIVVTIYDKYDVPLVGFFGSNGLIEFTSSGRADCIDHLGYLLGVKAIGDPENSPVQSLPDSDTCLVSFITDQYSNQFHAVVPVLRGKSIASSNRYSHSTMPKNPRLNGMKFMGWKTSSGGGFSSATQINENITVYGTWQCLVNFNADGGKVSPTFKYVDYMKTTSFPVPSKNGYSFSGWYTGKNGSGTQYFSDSTVISKNVTLYAYYKCTHEGAMTKGDKPVRSGTCQAASLWKYTCSRCGYSENREGDKGNHIESSWITKKKATCEANGYQVKECTVSGCGKVLKTEILGKTGHNWGRCGKSHDFRSINFKIATHAKGYRSVEAECIICANCKLPAPTRAKGYPNKSGEWVTRAGQQVSDGMICRKHIVKGKEYVDGDQYNDMQNLHIH